MHGGGEMSGLEKIISTIDSQAAASIDEINAQAQAKEQELLKKAEQEGDARYSAIVEDTKGRLAIQLSSAKTQAEARVKQAVLEGKVELLNDTLEKTLNTLHDMPNGEFEELVLSIARGNVTQKSGEIRFNEHCLNKLSADFINKLNDALGTQLTLCANAQDIADGFVINSGLVEVNCTFEAIIEANRQELSDVVCEKLFS